MNVMQILEWYLEAGVDETFGMEPFGILKTEETKINSPIKKIISSVRPATTELAQSGVSAVSSAREACTKADTLDELKSLVDKFDGCALKLTAANTVFGTGIPKARIMLIGEAPGADEDRAGLPFVGRSGHLLDKMLSAIQVKREECYITNILPWRPPGNRTPTDGEIAVCLPFLKRQIDLINPQTILVLGGSAAGALLDTAEPISKLRGKWSEYKMSTGGSVPVMASFHPAYLLRNSGQKAKAWNDFLRIKKKLCNEL